MFVFFFNIFLKLIALFSEMYIMPDSGYPYDGRADKNPYPHVRRADKDSYPHDSNNHALS